MRAYGRVDSVRYFVVECHLPPHGYAAPHSGKPLAYRRAYSLIRGCAAEVRGAASTLFKNLAGKAEPFRYLLRQSRVSFQIKVSVRRITIQLFRISIPYLRNTVPGFRITIRGFRITIRWLRITIRWLRITIRSPRIAIRRGRIASSRAETLISLGFPQGCQV